MSSVEPCLETKPTDIIMETTSSDFLDAFKTVDEDKDSDEESFHLFLDADEEFNKSDDKSPFADLNNTNEEEIEKVNEPISEENENPLRENENSTSMMEAIGVPQNGGSEISQKERTENEDFPVFESESNKKSVDKETIKEINEQCTIINEETSEVVGVSITNQKDDITSNVKKNDSEQLNSLDKEKQSTTDEENKNGTIKSDKIEQNELDFHLQTNENSESEVNVISLDENTKIEKQQKNVENEPDNEKLTENQSESVNILNENKSTINDCDENEIPSETEDEILNKDSTDLDNEEDVDPHLEETLLNDCEEIEEEDRSKKVEQSDVNNMKTVRDKRCGKIQNSKSKKFDGVNKNKQTQSELVISEVKTKCDNNKNTVNGAQSCDDNSNDTEDLLDISMIKDSAQDDADIAEDALQLEQEIEDTNTQNSNRKSVEMENGDESSNLENSDEDGKDYNSETQYAITEKENEDETEMNLDKEIESMRNDEEMPEINGLNDDDNDIVEKAASKRTLSEEDDRDCEPKKIKLVGDPKVSSETPAELDGWDITELQSLISFSKFMTKSHLKQLTRKDLEEFCVQKLCEAILHKSELGETNHQLKIQEQTIESLRKEQSILAKQIKDLEIVNKKLMHEVKCHMGNKPIAPVRITRSVGLQVRMAQASEVNGTKRRSNQMSPLKNPSTPVLQSQTTPINNNSRSPRHVQNNNTANRQIMSKSPIKQQSTPILNQVLQPKQQRTTTALKNVLTQNTPIRPLTKQNNNINNNTPIPTDKKAKTSGSSFIDLTDEDDRRSSSIQAIVPQGVRINSIPKTSAISTVLSSVVSSNAPQLMYVVQSNSQIKQGLLTTPAGQQKTVLVNFQPTNGMLNALNTSSVSVIPKMTTNVQLKASPIIKLNKHPAPLPNQPLVQGTNKNLKGIPPKPELTIRKTNTGIILQWRMPYELGLYESIASYQLFAYQVTSALPSTEMWRKVGDVKAMALPMACTLTQFPDKNKYYFAVRPVDIHKRIGKFSDPEEISL